MNYVINVSHFGVFHFEINRISDFNSMHIEDFVKHLRDCYPFSEGYKIEVKTERTVRNKVDI